MTENVTTIDLFAGCGGLSLGFDLLRGPVRFETVLALDNSPQAVRCYNANQQTVTGRKQSDHPTARIFDMTWFSHPAEILLYYLIHYSYWHKDAKLQTSLNQIRTPEFFANLRSIDERASESFAALAADKAYASAQAGVDPRLFNLAIFNAFIDKLNLASFRTLSISQQIPWADETREVKPISLRHQFPQLPEIRNGLETWLANEVAKLREASSKSGKGQNAVVSQRLKTFTSFLDSSEGTKLLTLWLDWRAKRDNVRAQFVTGVSQKLVSLYEGERRVRLILGGPPCKGFSRIGRAVIVSLRDQGAHAWASHEYGDERNALLFKYVLFLEALRPDTFLFENVAHFGSALRTPKGILDASEMLHEAINTLSSSRLDYHVCSSIVRAREYAIPQDRDRFIMFGVRSDKGSMESAENFFDLQKYRGSIPLIVALQGLDTPTEFRLGTADGGCTSTKVHAFTFLDPRMPTAYKQFISWIRQPAFGQTGEPTLTDAHIFRRMRKDDAALLEKFGPGQRWMDYKIRSSETIAHLRTFLEKCMRFQSKNPSSELPSLDCLRDLLNKVNEGLCLRLLLEQLSGPATNFIDEPNHLLSDAYLSKGHDSHGDWFERLDAMRPCKTIVAHIGKDTYGYFHPFETRAITIREAARIQSFPDFFEFGSIGVVDGYSVIGNAVPPLLANIFASRISELVFQAKVNGITKPRSQRMIQPKLITA